jgi:hypothetical protein
MRGLSQQFLADLREGILAPIGERVIQDRSLCLEIRDDCVNVYYRGGSLLEISKSTKNYMVFFDPAYFKSDEGTLDQPLPDKVIQKCENAVAWLSVLPDLKQAMDLHLGRHPREEREAQQLILRDNNFGVMSRATDYYVCDIEYAHQHGRIDLVAVHWPSKSPIRKKQKDRRLVLVEAKYGDGTIADPAGIHSHIKDINRFLEDTANLKALKNEMVGLFNQKRALRLINCSKDLVAFSDEPPMLLLTLVNHDPDSSSLRKAL